MQQSQETCWNVIQAVLHLGGHKHTALHLPCIRAHLEYAYQLWDPYTDKGTQALESVQKFACEVRLKRWDMDYESMLQQLELTSLSQRCKFFNTNHNVQ